MDEKHLREFAERPRGPVELEAAWRAAHAGVDEARSSLQVGNALLEHARAVAPASPTAEYLAADLDHRVLLEERLDRASQALAPKSRR